MGTSTIASIKKKKKKEKERKTVKTLEFVIVKGRMSLQVISFYSYDFISFHPPGNMVALFFQYYSQVYISQ